MLETDLGKQGAPLSQGFHIGSLGHEKNAISGEASNDTHLVE